MNKTQSKISEDTSMDMCIDEDSDNTEDMEIEIIENVEINFKFKILN